MEIYFAGTNFCSLLFEIQGAINVAWTIEKAKYIKRETAEVEQEVGPGCPEHPFRGGMDIFWNHTLWILLMHSASWPWLLQRLYINQSISFYY